MNCPGTPYILITTQAPVDYSKALLPTKFCLFKLSIPTAQLLLRSGSLCADLTQPPSHPSGPSPHGPQGLSTPRADPAFPYSQSSRGSPAPSGQSPGPPGWCSRSCVIWSLLSSPHHPQLLPFPSTRPTADALSVMTFRTHLMCHSLATSIPPAIYTGSSYSPSLLVKALSTICATVI